MTSTHAIPREYTDRPNLTSIASFFGGLSVDLERTLEANEGHGREQQDLRRAYEELASAVRSHCDAVSKWVSTVLPEDDDVDPYIEMYGDPYA